METLPTRQLGPFQVSAIGLGAMPLSMGHNVRPSEEQAIATVHAALDAGITFIDTADIYAPSWDTMGHNEALVAKALRSYPGPTDHVVVATKGGITRFMGEQWGRNGSPEYIHKAVEDSLRALDRDVIDLYQWHRPDRWRVYAEVIETFKVLQMEGKIKAIGISNADVEEIEIAIEVLGEGGLASVQNQYSPSYRCSAPELEFCAEHGVTFLPWSPLGGTGSASKEVGSAYAPFGQVAAARGVSPQQVALAWELSLGEQVIPIPGASRPQSITDSAKAATLPLSEEELADLGPVGCRP